MNSCALLVQVCEFVVAEDKWMIFFSGMSNSMKSRNSINQFVDLGKVDLDDGEAGRPFPEILEIAMDFVDHCAKTFGYVVGEAGLSGEMGINTDHEDDQECEVFKHIQKTI